MDDFIEGGLPFKHSLIIARRFSNFWTRYRIAVIIFYLIKGPVLLFEKKRMWDDLRMFYSLIAVSLSALTVSIGNWLVYFLMNLFTMCCNPSLQFKVLGHLYIICLVF